MLMFVLLVSAASPASLRAASFYTDEATFNAALGAEPAYFESFETRFDDAFEVDSVPGVTIFAETLRGAGILSIGPEDDPNDLVQHAQRGIGMVTELGIGGGLRFEFDRPVNAFAIDIVGALDLGFGNRLVRMTTCNGDTFNLFAGLQPPGNIRFGGVIDTTRPFTCVTVFNTQGGDGVQFDRMRYRPVGGAVNPITRAAYPLMAERVTENRDSFFIYKDADSGLNHGFPSGLFGEVPKIDLKADCIHDAGDPDGCSDDPNALDRTRVNVLRITFDPLLPGEFVGVNFEEPERWGVNRNGVGYDLSGATHIEFDVSSPTGAHVQFGVADKPGVFRQIPAGTAFGHVVLSLSSLGVTPADLTDTHVLFTVATNDTAMPNGGILLLDNIELTPTPSDQADRVGFPLGSQSFGVVPSQSDPFPTDQVIRNLTTIYESALTMLALFDRGRAQDIGRGCQIAEAFHYALQNDNQGVPIPVAPDGSRALHSGYESGDLALFNSQGAGAGQKGQVRLSGFSANLCAPSNFCLVLDGTTGGNNTFAMLGLFEAHRQCRNPDYLEDARTIGRWIEGLLRDTTGTGYGGYYLGYPDGGQLAQTPPPDPIKGKSIENNADIFHAFTLLAKAATDPLEAAAWTERANFAGDFVMELFDDSRGCFFAGTVPVGTPAGPGLDPSGPVRGGDVINVADFLDSNSFTTLAMAESPRYRNQIDWRRPVQCVLDNFAQSVSDGGNNFGGFNIVGAPTGGADGISWEFTGQAVVLMRLVDELYNETRFQASADFYLGELQRALALSPFGDARGLVAATLENGESLTPINQCLATPFQCIPARVGLAATTWGIFAERNFNPLGTSADDLIAGFGSGFGIWAKLNNATWIKQHGATALRMTTGDLDGSGRDDLVVDFGPGLGIWAKMNNATWVKQHGASSEAMTSGDLDGSGQDDLVVDFGTGLGIWAKMNNRAWIKLHGASGQAMTSGDLDGSGQDDLVVDFGTGVGIWARMNNSAWVKRHGSVSQGMTAGDLDGNGLDDLVIDFGPPLGIWARMNDSTWVKQNGAQSGAMSTGDLDGSGQDDLVVAFGPPLGIWAKMNNSAWVKLHSLSGQGLVEGDLDGGGRDDLVVDFGATLGLWARMNNATWIKQHGTSPEELASGDLDGN